MNNLLAKWNQISLVKRIIIGLIIGIILALTVPEQAKGVVILGSLFVGALKAIAPILVLFLVMSAISQDKAGQQTNMKSIIVLYLPDVFIHTMSFMFICLYSRPLNTKNVSESICIVFISISLNP